jgi:type IX secretion system PorP/SprF family membrane protein
MQFRKFILFFLLILGAGLINAQQLPHYTYFTYNYLQYNPAVTGATPCLEMKLGYRQQWNGFPDAPKTAFANFHGKFGKTKFNFHGLGGIVESDDAGPLSYTSLHFSYAYHMRVARKYMLSTGLSAGFLQYRVDYGAILLDDYDDPALNQSVADFVLPQINFGFWLYRGDRFYGLSFRHLNENKVDGLEGETKLNRHYTFSAGRSIRLKDELFFKPALLINYVSSSKMSLDVQALLEFREKFTIGLAARSGNGIGGIMKLALFKYVTLAYAYDMTLSKIRYSGLHTHEVILAIRACAGADKYHVPCAAYD